MVFKYKHGTIYNSYENESLWNVDIKYKVKGLQFSWIKKLFDNSFHEWNLFPIHLIKKFLGENFIFHSNVGFKRFPIYQILSRISYRLWKYIYLMER